MADSWNKKEREKKKQAAKKEKLEKRQERKDSARNGNDLNSMMAYIDENGNLTSTPTDPSRRREVSLEDIQIGVPTRAPGEEDEPNTGVVSFFNTGKGFGFIRDDASRQSLFVHINDLEGPINEGDKVTYVPGKSPKGPVALQVKKLN
jgi:cold shock CspA family protein